MRLLPDDAIVALLDQPSTALWPFKGVVFAPISLWIAMGASIVTAILWAIIATQRFVYGDPASRGDADSG